MIEVHFENPQSVFQPGDNVSGTVFLTLDEPMKARTVTISLKGKAHVRWTESYVVNIGNSSSNVVSNNEAKVVYANEEAIVFEANEKKDHLEAGEHQFLFDFRLPEVCPPSFEGNHGGIRYKIVVEIDRKWNFNKTNKKIFTVAPNFDVAEIVDALLPVRISEQKNLGLIPFRKGKVSVQVEIPKKVCVPGESIAITCDVSNETSKPIVKVDVELRQKVKFVGKLNGYTVDYTPGLKIPHYKKKRCDRKEISSIGEILDIGPKSKETLQLTLNIPSTVSTVDKELSPIIIIKYYLEIKFSTAGSLGNTIRAKVPVIIGSRRSFSSEIDNLPQNLLSLGIDE